jgi:hypothetical protein
MVRSAEQLSTGLELAFAHLEGARCFWVIDPELQPTVDPLLLANEMGEAQGHA